MEIEDTDIIVAHRLGRKQTEKSRAMVAKCS